MLRKLVDHHDVDPGFLEVPLGFFSRNTDEEQSFCVPWSIREVATSIRAFLMRIAQARRADMLQKSTTHFDMPSTRAIQMSHG